MISVLPSLAVVPTGSVRGDYPFGEDILVNDLNDTSAQYYPDVAAYSSGTVYAVWEDYRNDPDPGSGSFISDIYFAKSTDGGLTFSDDVWITSDAPGGAQVMPSVAAFPNGTVFVIWSQYGGPCLSLSRDEGNTFHPRTCVASDLNITYTLQSDIVVDSSGSIHLVFVAVLSGELRVIYARSDDGGSSFSVISLVDDGTIVPSRSHSSIQVGSDGMIYVAWDDSRSGNKDVYLSTSSDGGLTFGDDVRVNDDTGTENQDLPSLAVGRNGTLYVVWRDWRNSRSDIYFSKSTDGGRTFGDGLQNNNDVMVDDYVGPSGQSYPQIVVDSGENIFVVWDDFRNGLNDCDIYFSSSSDGGETFGDGLLNNNDMRVNDDIPGTSQKIPAIDIDDSGSLYVVWYDNRRGQPYSPDVYLCRLARNLPDLVVSGGFTGGISFSPPPPQVEGSNVTIEAFVFNVGEENTSNVRVRFYDGPPSENSQIGQDVFIPFIEAGGYAPGNTTWIANSPSLHLIYVVADPDNEILEKDEKNNVAYESFEVLSAVDPSPPGNVDACLSGHEFTDVLLTWSLSADDGKGRRSVVRYDIYRNETHFDSHAIGYGFMASVPNGTSAYVDQHAGYGDERNFFYVVCAVRNDNESTCSNEQAGKFSKPLSRGWHLVSIPLALRGQNVEEAIRTVGFSSIRRYDASSEKWSSYWRFKNYGTTEEVNPSMGFWVEVSSSGWLTVAGKVPRETILRLHEGWNMVGYPSFLGNVTVRLLKETSSVEEIQRSSDIPPFNLGVMQEFEYVYPGEGYWFLASEESEMVVQNY